MPIAKFATEQCTAGVPELCPASHW